MKLQWNNSILTFVSVKGHCGLKNENFPGIGISNYRIHHKTIIAVNLNQKNCCWSCKLVDQSTHLDKLFKE